MRLSTVPRFCPRRQPSTNSAPCQVISDVLGTLVLLTVLMRQRVTVGARRHKRYNVLAPAPHVVNYRGFVSKQELSFDPIVAVLRYLALYELSVCCDESHTTATA